MEEGSGDESADKNVQDTLNQDSKVNTNQENESESSVNDKVQESENEVKVDGPTEDQNLANAEKKDNEKCKKCIKPSWRGNHPSICESCEKRGVITPIFNHDQKHVEKCKKCTKKKFKARHDIFCSECPIAQLYKDEKADKKKQKKVVPNLKKVKTKQDMEENKEENNKSTKEEGKTMKLKKEHKGNKKNGDAEKFKNTDNIGDEVNKQDKNKNRKQNKNKNKKEKKQKNKTKTNEKPKKATSGIKFATTVMKDNYKPKPVKSVDSVEANLGPLGSLIKYLVESNTFT